MCLLFFFLMIRRPPRSTLSSSSAASDVYKRQAERMAAMLEADNLLMEARYTSNTAKLQDAIQKSLEAGVQPLKIEAAQRKLEALLAHVKRSEPPSPRPE
eukprot:TRINITY_DN51087_c0_g2_i1.p1 TRINITY_DN51087_c0_g2~~TRINITY_DN51087_c0_g2_i1.p1  ORF type:complete len:100 (+),score=34.27 TRINITY_DN51087_c0_g2_i1:61-360(+)